MYDQHLMEMAMLTADAVVSSVPSGTSRNSVVNELAERIKSMLQEDCWIDKIALTWTIDDVRCAIHEDGRKITKDQARNVLDRVLHKHDASIGVNWDVLRVWANSILDEEGEPDAWEEGWEPDEE